MFGLFDDVIDGIERLASDPISESTRIVTQPVRDAIYIIDGLSEGELREEAIMRLGADVVSGMALSEILDWYTGQ